MPRLANTFIMLSLMVAAACSEEIVVPETFGSIEGRVVACRGTACVDVANGTQVTASKPGATPLSFVLTNTEVFRFEHIPTGEWTLEAESSAVEIETGCWLTYEPRTVMVRNLETTKTVINGTYGC